MKETKKVTKADLKNQIVKEYQNRVNGLENKPVSKKDLTQIIDLSFGTVSRNLAKGHTVAVPGFGQFEIHDRPQRKGHNPQTGESMTIPAHKAPVFKASAPLKRIVNQND